MTKIVDYPNESLLFDEVVAPGTPAAATVRLYAKSDGLLYSKDDAGTETPLGGGSGGTPGGADTQVQFNDGGAFGGDAGMVYDKTTNTLTVEDITTTGLLLTAASATGSAGLNLPHGTAPTTPNNGDAWTTTAGLFVRINGVTIGPLAAGGSVADADYGDITVSGVGTVWDIDADVVTNTKLANVATATFKGRTTAGTGDPEDLTVAQAKTLLDLTGTNSGDQTITLTGDVTGSGTGSFAATIANDAVTNAKAADMATDTIKGRTTAGTGDPEDLTPAQVREMLGSQSIIVACSDETTALTTGVAKVTFRMPYAFTLTAVRASVTTAPTGAVLTVDINESGATILSTKITIDATETTSTTAATPPVISDTALADDAEITIDIDTVGSTIAGTGLKVTLIGYAT